jgi:hypothetical protein
VLFLYHKTIGLMPQADVSSPHQPQMVLGFQLGVNHLFRSVAPSQALFSLVYTMYYRLARGFV